MTNGSGRRACEFQLLRYVPDAVRNEFVHIGVILREQGGREPAQVRFTRDWRQGALPGPGGGYRPARGNGDGVAPTLSARAGRDLMRRLKESLSLSVQLTERKAYLAESLPAGMEELMRLAVQPLPKEKVPRLSGRAAIQARMRSEFEHAGVWDLLRKRIAASDLRRRRFAQD